MMDEIEKLRTGLLLDCVDDTSAKLTIQKWVKEFTATDYPNRMITRQTVVIFQRARQMNIPIEEKYLKILPSQKPKPRRRK
jgi:hypothetical protein